MNIFCPNPPNDCPDPSAPVTNYSSEALDNRAFFGRSYNVQEKPPLGSPWESTGCIGTCVSEISQADADACAQRQLITCLGNEWPVYEDNPNDDPEQPPVLRQPRTTYVNEEKIGTFTCPDGEVFTYTVPAGTVAAFSQAAADSFAQSMADNGAIANRICIGDVTPAACVNEEYTGTSEISAPEREGGYSLSLQAGSLPDGISMSLSGTTITFTGTPTTGGEYPFTVQVEDAAGNSIQKTFTIYVIGIAQDTLTNGTVGNAYSQTLTPIGPTVGTVTWAVVAGFFPPGLTLNSSTGEISGIPTSQGTANFTISMTDER